jgi:hypothetical protein
MYLCRDVVQAFLPADQGQLLMRAAASIMELYSECAMAKTNELLAEKSNKGVHQHRKKNMNDIKMGHAMNNNTSHQSETLMSASQTNSNFLNKDVLADPAGTLFSTNEDTLNARGYLEEDEHYEELTANGVLEGINPVYSDNSEGHISVSRNFNRDMILNSQWVGGKSILCLKLIDHNNCVLLWECDVIDENMISAKQSQLLDSLLLKEDTSNNKTSQEDISIFKKSSSLSDNLGTIISTYMHDVYVLIKY